MIAMKQLHKLLALGLAICLLAAALCGCGGQPATKPDDNTGSGNSGGSQSGTTGDPVDYAGQLKLNMNSATVKQEVTVKQFVDGDTTHFHVPASVIPGGVLKARYLAINTPECTGKIEEYGKKAASFTKEKLSAATSIIIESEDAKWNPDSTGDRYLTWVWYKTADMTDYRNLNVEILQNGLAVASKTADNQYGDIAMAALTQARNQKLNVFSGQKDPDFYYGDAMEISLKELRLHASEYENKKVIFEGVVTVNSAQTAYVEEFDPETGRYFGMTCYYGYDLSSEGQDILSVGNRVRIVGSVQYYAAGGTWQVSDLGYRVMKPDDPNNIQKISDGHSPSYVLTDPKEFAQGKVKVQYDETSVTEDYAKLVLSTTVEMKNLQVQSIYTTQSGDSKGAMTMRCKVNGVTINVRTGILYDADKNLIRAEAYQNKTIDVKGIVDYFDGEYQIKVYNPDCITVH